MRLESKEFEIPKNGVPDSKYIEQFLEKEGVKPLRWAIVKVEKESFVVSAQFKTD